MSGVAAEQYLASRPCRDVRLWTTRRRYRVPAPIRGRTGGGRRGSETYVELLRPARGHLIDEQSRGREYPHLSSPFQGEGRDGAVSFTRPPRVVR